MTTNNLTVCVLILANADDGSCSSDYESSGRKDEHSHQAAAAAAPLAGQRAPAAAVAAAEDAEVGAAAREDATMCIVALQSGCRQVPQL
jgi:hypothetical protein